MIVILKSIIENDLSTGLPSQRAATIWISDSTTAYVMQVGNLALTGSLQTILNGMEADLWTLTQSGGVLATPTENEIAGAIQWYVANSGAKSDVFDKSITQLHTDITAMVAASFPPPISAAVRTGWVRTLMSSLLDTRVNGHDRDLV